MSQIIMTRQNLSQRRPREVNPLTNQLTIEASEVLMQYTRMVDSKIIEKSPPVNIYASPEYFKRKQSLSSSAKDMLDYIFCCLGNSRETVQIIYEQYCERCGEISLRSFNRTIAELITTAFIAKKVTRKNVYYINPAFFFRGNRIKAYPDNVKIVYTQSKVDRLRELKVLPDRDMGESNLLPDDEE